MAMKTPAKLLYILLIISNMVTAQSPLGALRIMQGPMVGAVTPTSINIWLRTSDSFPVFIEYSANSNFLTVSESERVIPTKEHDYTEVIEIRGLQPSTTYYYRIIVDGKRDKYLSAKEPFQTKTAPEINSKTNFSIGFGSCPRFQVDRIQPIWRWVSHYNPDLFIWTGDNIYGDALDPHILRDEYKRQRDLDLLQPVINKISNLALWDDHDFGLNNSDKRHPEKEKALMVFKEYWANPSYGLDDVPGVFFKYSYSSVDFFLLDNRYHRDPNKSPDIPGKTHLGTEQLKWLKKELANSKAVFKLLVAGGGWSSAKDTGGDSWASYLNERDDIFNFIRDNNIGGVVLLSGDTHVGELNVIPWSEKGGYDLYDLDSSPLAQHPSGSWIDRRPERRVRAPYFSTANFGLIEFDFTTEPTLYFTLIDIYGNKVWKPLELKESDLRNGVVSWKDKVDPNEIKRQENYEKGKGYFEKPD